MSLFINNIQKVKLNKNSQIYQMLLLYLVIGVQIRGGEFPVAFLRMKFPSNTRLSRWKLGIARFCPEISQKKFLLPCLAFPRTKPSQTKHSLTYIMTLKRLGPTLSQSHSLKPLDLNSVVLFLIFSQRLKVNIIKSYNPHHLCLKKGPHPRRNGSTQWARLGTLPSWWRST